MSNKTKFNLSFAGCGFLGIYHVGVAACLKKYAPQLVVHKASGASAGAIAACCLLCDAPLGKEKISVFVSKFHLILNSQLSTQIQFLLNIHFRFSSKTNGNFISLSNSHRILSSFSSLFPYVFIHPGENIQVSVCSKRWSVSNKWGKRV